MHVGAFRAVGAHVTALCGLDAEKTRAVAAEEAIPLVTTDVRVLVDAVDVVVVASPPAQHAAHVEGALAAGRHVLCEKPLAPTAEASARLAAQAARSAAVSAVSFPYRMLPPLAALKGWLAGRRVDHLVATVRNHFARAEEADPAGGPLGRSGDLGGASHVVDAALWLCGARPSWVQASLAGAGGSLLHVGLEGGGRVALAHVPCDEAGIHGGWSLLGAGWEAGFTAGYVPALGGWVLSDVRVREGGAWHTLAPGLAPRPGGREPWAEAHVTTARHLLAAVRGEARGPLASLGEGARVQAVLHAAADAEARGARVALEG
jgi:predicted dehydrogenase